MGLLLSCYPTGQPAEPKVYAAAIMTAIERYPEQVIATVTDPRGPLLRTCRFLPSIAEVVAACESEMEPIRREEERQARYEETRRLYLSPPPADAPRPTYEDLKAKYGDNWGLKTLGSREEAEAERAKRNAEMARSSRVLFEKECIAAGVDPSKAAISPSLARLMAEKLGGSADDEPAASPHAA